MNDLELKREIIMKHFHLANFEVYKSYISNFSDGDGFEEGERRLMMCMDEWAGIISARIDELN